MHVEFATNARGDLADIRDYLEPRNPQAFVRLFASITTIADQLGRFPFLGRPGRIATTREISIPRYPYVIVYSIPDEYTLRIDAILHTSRKWPSTIV